MADRPLTPRQVAALFNVSITAVASWADEGKLRYFRTPGGHRRFHRDDVERFLADLPARTEEVPA